jgi:uncharacterized membrane protein
MPGTTTSPTGLDRALDVILGAGRPIFALAIIAFGVETFIVARVVSDPLGPQSNTLPVIPWLPAITWLAYLFGAVWVVCGLGLISNRTIRPASLTIGTLLTACTLLITVPVYARNLPSIPLRTAVFEPLSIACLAWLLPGPSAISPLLERISRYLAGLSMLIFGIDHFLALQFIANLLPPWIPWHVFWVAFFGVAFIAAGFSIAFDVLQRWGAACLGLMFGIWVITLHLPRVLGLYGIPGAPHNPNEWSSLSIAVALWGGLWALARRQSATRLPS